MFVAAEAVGRTVELDHACLAAVVAGARTMSPDQLSDCQHLAANGRVAAVFGASNAR